MVECISHLFPTELEIFSPLLIQSSGDVFQLALIQLIILQEACRFLN